MAPFWRKKIEDWGLKSDRVFIIPTKLGFIYIAINFVVFMMGLSYANNMALMLAFLLFAFLLVNMISANQNLLATTSVQVKIQDGFAPQTEVKLNFPGHRVQDYSLELGKLTTNQITEDTFVIQAQAGKYTIDFVKLFTQYPASLFHLWRIYPQTHNFYLYPTPIPWDLTPPIQSQVSSLAGQGDFETHIKYHHSLSAKRIDWKAFAKRDELYWKKGPQEYANQFRFNLDSVPAQELQQKLGQLSFALNQVHLWGAQFALELPGIQLPLGQGELHYRNCLEALACYATDK